MKTTKSKTMLVSLGLFFLLLTTLVNAQQKITKAELKQQQMVGNLISGINSENTGLRRSCIYFAGKYKVEKTVDVLIEQLEKETLTENKYLISLSLFLIGDQKGMDAVKRVAAFDKNPRAKRLANAVYSEYLLNETDRIALVEKMK